LSGKGFCFTFWAFRPLVGVYRFGKKIEYDIAVFTIEFVDRHGNSLTFVPVRCELKIIKGGIFLVNRNK
jgi:hypothetical protein